MSTLGTMSYQGDFSKTTKFLTKVTKGSYLRRILDKYGQKGVDALASVTPMDTGLTAASWSYEIVEDDNGVTLWWKNSNLGNGWAPIALLLQYGHATGTGGYVVGRDYINPALRPIFDKMAKDAWQEVTQ